MGNNRCSGLLLDIGEQMQNPPSCCCPLGIIPCRRETVSGHHGTRRRVTISVAHSGGTRLCICAIEGDVQDRTFCQGPYLAGWLWTPTQVPFNGVGCLRFLLSTGRGCSRGCGRYDGRARRVGARGWAPTMGRLGAGWKLCIHALWRRGQAGQRLPSFP